MDDLFFEHIKMKKLFDGKNRFVNSFWMSIHFVAVESTYALMKVYFSMQLGKK